MENNTINKSVTAEDIALVIANERRKQWGKLSPMNLMELKKDSCWKGLLDEGKAIMGLLNG